ncbi:carboxypeptidase-like regulatory domain-containing protein [Mariniphaga sediminis]|uniref:Carboxypeptidase-like regulatory domain-containing protein n=1 Tax=Mariniphaga sediminis TaxID=1628158 RepID=A0A399CWW0_9BACT|nr:carboxypeptidase-like regulatory domain-containing protein [Mariniphaga sediminis]RIH63706.1 carboxypeptidase-like regulatory domain-containing protein [Mariniphaga sediminis]
MRFISFSIWIAILLISLQVGGQQQDGSVLERRVSIHAERQPLTTVLDQISWQAKVYFSFDASLIETDKMVTIKAIDKSLYFVLNQLFNPDDFSLTEMENQIIITKNQERKKGDQTVEPDTIPIKYFFLSGKILDRKKKNPVSYASVSVFNKPVGTITNADGEFLLKLHPQHINDTLIISSMGYARIFMPAHKLLDEDLILLEPVTIRIREIKVTAISPDKLLENIRENLEKNYTSYPKLMTAFYRETVRQDGEYINVSEAVVEILKAPYINTFRNDVVRLMKGRQSPDVQPFKWMNFKLQGGPFTITQLDVVKTMETFIDKDYQHHYNYKISRVVRYNDIPVYILEFEPVNNIDFHGFIGEIYVHRETFAIVHARFGFDRSGLKKATPILVKRTPPGVKARPSFVEYHVNYQHYQGKWQLATTRASIKFKIRSRVDNINSEFHSVSDLLITDIQPTELKRFRPDESFSRRDIFVEMIGNYDPKFWENFNIIKPDEDLRNAMQKLTSGN